MRLFSLLPILAALNAGITLTPLATYTGEPAYILNGDYVVSLGDGQATLYQALTGNKIPLAPPPSTATRWQATPDHLFDGTHVYSLATGQRVGQLPAPPQGYNRLLFALDPTDFTRAAVLTNPNTGDLGLVDLTTGVVEPLPYATEVITDMAISADGRWLALDSLVLYDLERGTWVTSDPPGWNPRFFGDIIVYGAVGGDGERLYAVHLTHETQVSIPDAAVLAGAGNLLVVGPPDRYAGDVRLYDMATGTEVWQIRVDAADAGELNRRLPRAALSPAAGRLVLRLPDRVLLLDTATGATVREIEGAVRHMAFAPDGSWLAMAAEAGGAALLDAATGTAQTSTAGERVLQLVFSADSAHLLTQTEAGAVTVWRIEDRQQVG